MKIIFFGDSITDQEHRGSDHGFPYGLGYGFVNHVAGQLFRENPERHEIKNMGITGNKIVDLYARVKQHVWKEKPDVVSILVGINDVMHEISRGEGVDLERYAKVYSMLIEETKKELPNIKIILCEPFVLRGTLTEAEFERFEQIREYAKVVKGLAEKYSLPFLPLQDKFDEAVKKYDAKYYLWDGVHPNTAGAMLIAEEWVKLFKEQVEEK